MDFTAHGDRAGALSSAVETSPDVRATARLERHRAETVAAERNPLLRRILEALGNSRATPGDLAAQLGAAKETISRHLAVLRKQGLVQSQPVFGDGRLREYVLTSEGEVQLSRHRAFGAPSTPPPTPTPTQTVLFLELGLENALKLRRQTNQLGDAADRLRAVLAQAKKAELYELVVEATAELATTLRQDRERSQLGGLLDDLERIALGREPKVPAALALPAAAHRAYALGRIGEQYDGDLVGRAAHLNTAAQHYAELADAPSYGSPGSWRRRQAWSLVSLANNLRERSEIETALEQAGYALELFEDLDDPYGRSHCLFMFGFSLRLLGDFDGAWLFLQAAYEVASFNDFERFQADSLMQMGEVRRCQGEVGEARELLVDSLARAERMRLTVTQAFAQSALGAVEYQEERLQEAQDALKNAHQLFVTCGHSEGLVLNSRRQATAARRAAHATASAELDVVEGFIATALDGYVHLRSPAGITACHLEQGRLLLMRDGEAGGAVAKLHLQLDDTNQRNLLELDPWVPRVLEAFARDADERLYARARQLVAAAERRLANRVRECVQRGAQVVGELRRQTTEHTRAVALAGDEMGGETRRDCGVELLQPA